MIPFFELGAFPLGPVTLHVFGLVQLLAMTLGAGVAVWRSWRLGGGIWTTAATLFLMVVSGTFVGLGLSAVLYGTYGGISGFGTALGAAPVLLCLLIGGRQLLAARLDAVVLGAAVYGIVSRLGCFVVHDHVGGVTSFPLGVRGICEPDMFGEPVDSALACHDLGLYFLLAWAMLAGLLLTPAVVARKGLGLAVALIYASVAQTVIWSLGPSSGWCLGTLLLGFGAVAALVWWLYGSQAKTPPTTVAVGQ
jgi:hypothetical protein